MTIEWHLVNTHGYLGSELVVHVAIANMSTRQNPSHSRSRESNSTVAHLNSLVPSPVLGTRLFSKCRVFSKYHVFSK